LRNALKGTDAEEVKKKTQSLIQASMKLGEAVYKSQQKTAGKADNSKKDSKENKDKDNVVDADFEDVKKTIRKKEPKTNQ
jgi:molecular chaperone DnaK